MKHVQTDLTCVSFPGPGDKHIYTFNPMREFVHNYDAHVNEAFEDFKKTHKKEYASGTDHMMRKEVFRQNLRYILCLRIILVLLLIIYLNI